VTDPRPRDLLRWERGLGAPVGSAGAVDVRTTLAFTDRAQDAFDAEKPYGTGNLARHVGDDDRSVDSARQRLAERLGVAPDHLLFVDQVHGTDVVEAVGPWAGSAPQADAVVTTRNGLALAVMVADCVPVLLADPVRGAVGVAHAGRVGLAAGVVEAIGPGVTRVAVGDHVTEGQPLAAITTDKVESDVEAPVDGVVEEILVEAGSTVEVGTVIARIRED